MQVSPEIPNSVMTVLTRPYPEYNNSFGTFVNYICKPGFSMVDGKNVKNCNEDRIWLGKDIVCKGNLIIW